MLTSMFSWHVGRSWEMRCLTQNLRRSLATSACSEPTLQTLRYQRLSTYEVQIMLSSPGQPREDEQPVPGVGMDQFDSASLDALIARLRTSRPYAFKDLDRLAVLRRAKVLVSGQGDEDLVSAAGLLALGSYPQEYFPQLMVTFVHYPTDTGAQSPSGDRFLDNVTVEGSVPVMTRDTLAAIRRNMSRRTVIAGAGRHDITPRPRGPRARHPDRNPPLGPLPAITADLRTAGAGISRRPPSRRSLRDAWGDRLPR